MKNTFFFLVLTIIVLKSIDPCVSASTNLTDHTCRPSGFLQMKASSNTNFHCSSKTISNCCKAHKIYPKFHCSPPVTSHTKAIMTIAGFSTSNQVTRPISYNSNTKKNGLEAERGKVYTDRYVVRHNAITSVASESSSVDGSGHNKSTMSKCRNNHYGNDKEMIVKLSTGWYNGSRRCQKKVRINWKGKSVIAKVVGECDSVNGCDSTSGYRVPCKSNAVVASLAVWKALGVPKTMYGKLKITWSDA